MLQVPIVRGDLKTALRGLNMKIAKHGIETSLKLDRIPKPFAKRKAKEPLAWRRLRRKQANKRREYAGR